MGIRRGRLDRRRAAVVAGRALRERTHHELRIHDQGLRQIWSVERLGLRGQNLRRLGPVRMTRAHLHMREREITRTLMHARNHTLQRTLAHARTLTTYALKARTLRFRLLCVRLRVCWAASGAWWRGQRSSRAAAGTTHCPMATREAVCHLAARCAPPVHAARRVPPVMLRVAFQCVQLRAARGRGCVCSRGRQRLARRRSTKRYAVQGDVRAVDRCEMPLTVARCR